MIEESDALPGKRYVDERAFAFNLRKYTDMDRFKAALGQVANRRLAMPNSPGSFDCLPNGNETHQNWVDTVSYAAY